VQEQITCTLVPHLQYRTAESFPDTYCETHDVEGYEALLADDQERLARALQAFPASPLVFDIDRLMQFYRGEIAVRDQYIAVLKGQVVDKDQLLATQRRDQERYIRSLEIGRAHV